MTNNNIYFVANWKMYGNLTSLNALNKVINILIPETIIIKYANNEIVEKILINNINPLDNRFILLELVIRVASKKNM